MNYLQAVNGVLVRMRENQVSTVSTNDYSTLLGTFVNEAKREVEDTWNWSFQRNTIVVATVAGIFNYLLTGSGERFKVLQVFNDSQDYLLRAVEGTKMTRMLLSNSPQSGQPVYYAFNDKDSNGDYYVDLFPIPSAIQNINFDLVIPQVDLVADTDIIDVQGHLVVLGATLRALAERGDDNSENFKQLAAIYKSQLGAAIAQDESRMPCETDWVAV